MIPPWNQSTPVPGARRRRVRRRSRLEGCRQGEARATVRRGVDAESRSIRRRAPAAVDGRRAVACDVGADVDRARIAGLDSDRADRAVDRHGLRAGDQLPARASVGRLEQAEAGLGVAGAVGLAGACVERVPGWVVRIDDQRAEGVRRQVVRRRDPARLGGQRIVRAPDPATRGRDPESAGRAGRSGGLCAVGVDRERGDAPGLLRGRSLKRDRVEELRSLAGDVRRDGPEGGPSARARGQCGRERRPRAERGATQLLGLAIERVVRLEREPVVHVGARIGAVLDLLGGRIRRPLPLGLEALALERRFLARIEPRHGRASVPLSARGHDGHGNSCGDSSRHDEQPARTPNPSHRIPPQ